MLERSYLFNKPDAMLGADQAARLMKSMPVESA
jgi:hypothetical protein